MVESMKPGAVIVDLAAERGGNSELTEPGKIVHAQRRAHLCPAQSRRRGAGQRLEPLRQEPLAFLETMIDKKDKTLKVNWDDEIVKGTLVAKDGKIVHPNLQSQA